MFTPLRHIGLSEKEQGLYMTCLELGENPASVIAQHTKANRSTTYIHLEDLCHRGYLTRGSRHGIKTYSALDPDMLAEKLENDLKKQQRHIHAFRTSIPEIKAHQYTQITGPKVKFYQGESALEYMYESLAKDLSWVSFVDSESMVGLGGRFEELYWELGDKKCEADIVSRDILIDGDIGRVSQQRWNTKKYHIRLYPDRIHADHIFFEDRFFLVSYES